MRVCSHPDSSELGSHNCKGGLPFAVAYHIAFVNLSGLKVTGVLAMVSISVRGRVGGVTSGFQLQAQGETMSCLLSGWTWLP